MSPGGRVPLSALPSVNHSGGLHSWIADGCHHNWEADYFLARDQQERVLFNCFWSQSAAVTRVSSAKVPFHLCLIAVCAYPCDLLCGLGLECAGWFSSVGTHPVARRFTTPSCPVLYSRVLLVMKGRSREEVIMISSFSLDTKKWMNLGAWVKILLDPWFSIFPSPFLARQLDIEH